MRLIIVLLLFCFAANGQNVINSYRYESAGSSFITTEYQAIIDEATSLGYTLPSAGEQTAQDAILADLKTTGVWDSLDFFYWFKDSGDGDFKKINWLSPTNKGVAGASGEPTWATTGAKGNGTDIWLELHSTYTNIGLNSVSYSWQVVTAYTSTDSDIFSHDGLNTNVGNVSRSQYINSSGTAVRDTKDFSGTGYFGMTLSGTAFDGYSSGTSFDNSTESGTTALPDSDLFLLRYGTNYSDVEVGFICGGAAYNQLDLYNSVN